LRDLRIVDPSFPNQIQATFIARPNAILFCLENIKVVLKHSEALIFSPYQSEVKDVLTALVQQISLGYAAHDATSSEGESARFEHVVIEAALNLVCNDLFRRVRELAPAVASTLQGLRAESRGLDVIQTQVDELLPLKNTLDELRKRVKEVKRAITEILNNDEDLSMMYLKPSSTSTTTTNNNNFFSSSSSFEYLSNEFQNNMNVLNKENIDKINLQRKTFVDDNKNFEKKIENTIHDKENFSTTQNIHDRKEKNTMSLEILFENYLNEAEWISSEIEDLLDEITNTEENVVLQLDLLRNRILRFELYLSLSSFVVTCGALVTGFFGMNLLSHLETNKSMFYVVGLLMFSGMISLFVSMSRFAKKKKEKLL
jgi:Mg2+ and Co2+ transporter CorA